MLVSIVPVVDGIVIVTVTASVGVMVVAPDVAPFRTTDPMINPLNYKMTQRPPLGTVTDTPVAKVIGPTE